MNKRLLAASSLRVLTRYRLRSCFMSLGIVVGVAALVVMRSMGSGAEQEMLDRIERMLGAGSLIISNGAGATRTGISEPGKLSLEDLEAIDDQLEQVVDRDAAVAVGAREVRYRDRGRSVMIVGHSERAEFVWSRGVAEGEFFTEEDVRSAARVALVGSRTAEALFGGEDPVGRSIRIGTSPFRVKGVLEDHGFDPHGMDRDDEVHVPITTMMRRVLKRDVIGYAKLIVSDPNAVDDTVEEVAGLLRSRHGLGDDEPDDFSIHTPTQVQQTVREANRVLTVYLPATAGIALLVAAVVISNIMLIGVRERIAEIGLRKAVGATGRQIGAQFLLESLAVTLVSGVIGAGTGAAIVAGMGRWVSSGTRITPDSILLGLAAALAVGLLAGFLPARRAARQEPVDALR